jgi:hypothetical protein
VLLAGTSDGLGIQVAEEKIQSSEIGYGNFGVHERQNRATNCSREGILLMREQFETCAKAAAAKANEGNVDAIG